MKKNMNIENEENVTVKKFQPKSHNWHIHDSSKDPGSDIVIMDIQESNNNALPENNLNKNNTLFESNKTYEEIINNALFSQLSEINVKLLEFDEHTTTIFYKNLKGKTIPKIEYIEYTLLNQSVNISDLKKYGFGIYVFFFYLKNLLVTLSILCIFALIYIGFIFFKYYHNYEDEYSLFFDYNLLSLVSGVQIIRFRKFYIETYGKAAFLSKYKNFDVIHKGYIYSGVIIFTIAFIINFIFLLYLKYSYNSYIKENPEIKNSTLILSGRDLPILTDENSKLRIENKLKGMLDIPNSDIKIYFTKKLSEYYKTMEEFFNLKNDKYQITERLNKKECCYGCLCFHGEKCYCNLSAKDLETNELNIIEKIGKLDLNIDSNLEYNPLYLISFSNDEDYKKVYEKYPHSYLRNCCCKRGKKKSIYITKAPNPEDVIWGNFEFDLEYKFYISKIKNILWSALYLIVSFIIQFLVEIIGGKVENIIFSFILNIIMTIITNKIDDIFSDKIMDLLKDNTNFWSYSDTKFYAIIYQTIFKFFTQGLFPLFTYLIVQAIKKEDDSYLDLVNKIFVILEMDGFGYPLLDLIFYGFYKKNEDMKEKTEKIMSQENIENELSEQINNTNKLSEAELEETFKKEEMQLEENYVQILSIYWITMFYLSIYPIGVIQSFLNLLFTFIIEKNFLLNVYKRPEYIDPKFGFLCFKFFNFGYFLFLCGNIIFFKNEDNKKSFGIIYIIFMIFILICPFFLLTKIFNCCIKNQKNENKRINKDYGLFNPCDQRKEIKDILDRFKNENFLDDDQYKEAMKELNNMDNKDYYNLQKNLRTPKIMAFEKKKITFKNIYDDYIEINDPKEIKFYSTMMQLGFLKYLEPSNFLKPKRKRFILNYPNNIKSDSLIELSRSSVQQNFSNSDSGHFSIYQSKKNKKSKNKCIMTYIYGEKEGEKKEGEKNIKIFDVFSKRNLRAIKRPHGNNKIICAKYFILNDEDGNDNTNIEYLISIGLDNIMIINNLTTGNKIIKKPIGDSFYKNKNKKNFDQFSLSVEKHINNNSNNYTLWIITSYYYDNYFKIYDLSDQGGPIKKGQIPQTDGGEFQGENIISIQSLYYTPKNIYICVRTNKRIIIYINEYYINNISYMNLTNYTQNSYVNYKIMEININCVYLIITTIKNDLSEYSVDIFNIGFIFPFLKKFTFFRTNSRFFRFVFGYEINADILTEMNEDVLSRVNNNNIYRIHNYNIIIRYDESQIIKQQMKHQLDSGKIKKFEIGNILLWDNIYIIIGTPFDYLHIIDYRKEDNQFIGKIYNTESLDAKEYSNIIAYNMSDKIEDPEFGQCFIFADSKGKIQYIRPARVKDVLNYKITQTDEFFDQLSDDKKLIHIKFSVIFYLIYFLFSFFIPFLFALSGNSLPKKSADKNTYYSCFYFWIIYLVFGIWFKGCIYDINDEQHTPRRLTRFVMVIFIIGKIIANSALAYEFCIQNKTGIIIIGVLNIIYFAQFLFYLIIYCRKKVYLLKTFWLAFLFYQISKLCIIIFFILSIFFEARHLDTYIYAFILCFISIYMFMSNYYSTLTKEMLYDTSVYTYPFSCCICLGCCCKYFLCRSCCKNLICCCNIPTEQQLNMEFFTYIQAIYNYPFEWINLFCSSKCCNTPKETIEKIDKKCCCWEPICVKILNCLAQLILCILEILLYFIECICQVAGETN